MANHEFRSESSTSARPENSGKHTAWLMVQLEKELQGVADPARVAALQEVEEHLACSRMALEELGVSPQESDQQAVERFGSPQEFARKIIGQQSEPTKTPKALLTLTAATMTFLIIFLFTLPFLQIYQLFTPYLVISVALAAFVGLSWRARIFQWKSLSKLGLAVSLGLAILMGFTWVELWTVGGMGETPKWQVNAYRDTTERQLKEIPKSLAECNAAQSIFASGQAAVESSRYFSKGAYMTFQEDYLPQFGSTAEHHFGWTTNYIDAAQTWRSYGSVRNRWESYLADAQAQISALDAASKKVFDPMTAAQAMLGCVFLTCLAVLLNFFVSVFRSIYDAIRKLPKRLVA